MKLGFYAGRRVLLLVPVLLGVTFITFALTRIIPGDPISLIAGPYVSAARKAELRHAYFLDQPFYVQYIHYVGGLLRGHLRAHDGGAPLRGGRGRAARDPRRPPAELVAGRLLARVRDRRHLDPGL